MFFTDSLRSTKQQKIGKWAKKGKTFSFLSSHDQEEKEKEEKITRRRGKEESTER